MMKKNVKMLFWEVCIIVGVSFMFATVYNLFSSNPLPFIRQQKQIEKVSDKDLQPTIINDTTQSQQVHSSGLPEKAPDKPLQVATAAPKEKGMEKPVREKPVQNEKPASAENEKPILKTVTYEQLVRLLNDPGFLFVDARPAEEYNKGHIPNAINIFAYEENKNLYFSTIGGLPQNKTLIVYCDGGNCDASHKLAEDIFSFGFKKVFLYSGGWEEWIQKRK